DGCAEEDLDRAGVRGALSHLGFNLSRNPLRNSVDPALFDGRLAIFSRRFNHVRDRADARLFKIDMGGMAGVVDRRSVSAAWWKWRGHFVGKIYRLWSCQC